MDVEDDKTKEPTLEPEPFTVADLLEWLSTFALFAAFCYRKGYERGRRG